MMREIIGMLLLIIMVFNTGVPVFANMVNLQEENAVDMSVEDKILGVSTEDDFNYVSVEEKLDESVLEGTDSEIVDTSVERETNLLVEEYQEVFDIYSGELADALNGGNPIVFDNTERLLTSPGDRWIYDVWQRLDFDHQLHHSYNPARVVVAAGEDFEVSIVFTRLGMFHRLGYWDMEVTGVIPDEGIEFYLYLLFGNTQTVPTQVHRWVVNITGEGVVQIPETWTGGPGSGNYLKEIGVIFPVEEEPIDDDPINGDYGNDDPIDDNPVIDDNETKNNETSNGGNDYYVAGGDENIVVPPTGEPDEVVNDEEYEKYLVVRPHPPQDDTDFNESDVLGQDNEEKDVTEYVGALADMKNTGLPIIVLLLLLVAGFVTVKIKK